MINRIRPRTFLGRFRTVALAGMVVFLGACRPVSKGGLPACSPDHLGIAETLTPGGPEADWGVLIDSLSPTLEWSFSDSSCDPEYFQLRLYTNWPATYMPPAVADVRIPGSLRSWIPPDPLDTGTMYIWSIQAGVGDETPDVDWGIFRTGPECVVISPGTMSAPVLLYPPDGSVWDIRTPLFEWDDPTTCIPPGDYKVQISETPTFTDPIEVSSVLPYLGVQPPWTTSELSDCTRYYWRVKIDLRDRVDSEDGPWSETWSFTIRTSACTTLPVTHITPIPPFDFPIPGGGPGGGTSSEPSSWIDGHVWHDLCAVPYASTDIVPPGCIAVPGGGFEANGIFEGGEPGLEGVTVDLGAGPCPSTGLATTTTDSGGHYMFGPLAAGAYCVSINPLSEANISVLIPGSFTFPVRGCETGEYEITLGDADIRRENNFGWDFQFLPSPGSGTPTAKLLHNAYCRSGPSIEYRSLTTLFQGLEVPIDGRNADNSWWWVRIPNSLNHCWLAKENVETSGDTSKVPIVEAEPLGCWVKQQQGPDKCVAPCPQGAQPGGACEP